MFSSVSREHSAVFTETAVFTEDDGRASAGGATPGHTELLVEENKGRLKALSQTPEVPRTTGAACARGHAFKPANAGADRRAARYDILTGAGRRDPPPLFISHQFIEMFVNFSSLLTVKTLTGMTTDVSPVHSDAE
jgi:hypothetical protein